MKFFYPYRYTNFELIQSKSANLIIVLFTVYYFIMEPGSGMDFWRKIDASKYSDSELPAYPARTLTAHVAMKGLEFGSTIGIFLVSPAWSLLRKKPLSRTWRVATPLCAVVGFAASVGMLLQKQEQGALTVDGVDDRAYRLIHNPSQKEMDRRAMIGLALGLSSIILFRGTGNALAGGLTGLSLGALSVTAQQAAKKYLPDMDQK